MGDSGSGKTTLLTYLALNVSKKWSVYIYNTDYENFPIKDNLIPIKPDYNKVDDIEYLGYVINGLRAKYNNFCIIITDLDKFYDKTISTSKKSEPIKDLYGTGRHQRILTIIESKQPRYIPSKILANTNLFYISKFTEIEDVKRLKNYADVDTLKSLKLHEFVEVDKWTGSVRIVKLNANTGKFDIIRDVNNDKQ